jgi:hypothetical protein
MPTSSSPQRDIPGVPDRGFQPSTHAFGRLALQVPSDKQPTPRAMSLVAQSILTPPEAQGGAVGSAEVRSPPPWFRMMTPEERRVPTNRQLVGRWTRRLDVSQERAMLLELNPVKEDSAEWPCDRDLGCLPTPHQFVLHSQSPAAQHRNRPPRWPVARNSETAGI